MEFAELVKNPPKAAPVAAPAPILKIEKSTAPQQKDPDVHMSMCHLMGALKYERGSNWEKGTP